MARRYCAAPARALASFVLVLILCIAAPALHAQTQQWIKGIGGSGSEYGRFVEPTSDGGFAVGGTRSRSASSPVEDFWVARFDSNGTLLWQKTYGKANTTHTIFTFNTAGSGFMIGGFTGQQFSGTESALMYRIDSVGNVLWEYDVNYADSDHWHLLIERKTGGYYFGGHTDSKDDPNGDVWLVRLDENREIIWEKTYDRATAEHAHAGVETRDGGLAMLGHTEANGYEKYWVIKVDSLGEVMWQKVVTSGPTGHDSPYDVFETREGNIALVGGTSGAPGPNSSFGWLVVLDADGNELVDKHFGNALGSSFSWSGRQARDGGFVLAGHTNYRTKGNMDMYIVKTDASGELEWEKTYGGTDIDYGFDIVPTWDGYIGVGLTRSSGIMTGGAEDLMLVKIVEDLVLPGTVDLLSPQNGATNVAGEHLLVWAGLDGISRYQIQIAEDAAFTNIVLDDSTATSTTRSLAGLLAPGTQYFWHVRAANGDGWGPYSSAWSFTSTQPTTSVDELLAGATSVAMIPNPTSDDATVAITLDRPGRVGITIVDLLGNVAGTHDAGALPAGSTRVGIDARALRAGGYTLRMTRDGAVVATTRFTVAR